MTVVHNYISGRLIVVGKLEKCATLAQTMQKTAFIMFPFKCLLWITCMVNLLIKLLLF